MAKRLTSLILMISILFHLVGCGSRYEKYQAKFSGFFDTFMIIVGYAESESEFNRYAEIIYNRIEELHQYYDIYNAYDDLNNLYTINQNAGVAPVKVNRDIIDMLLVAMEGYHLTDGTVNIAMGPVLRLWHDYRTAGKNNQGEAQLPPMDQLQEAYKLTDITDVIINEADSTVFLRKPGMSLDVGAIAKGYAGGQAAQAVHDAGAVSMLLNIGGNVTSVGKPLDQVRDRWGIGIQDPDLSVDGTQNIMDTVYANDMTVSISGDYQRFYIVDGEVYNHIIDPSTLKPANRYKQVAVIYGDTGLADMISTALFILPQKEGAALAERTNAGVMWIDRDGNQTATESYIRISKSLGNYSAVD